MATCLQVNEIFGIKRKCSFSAILYICNYYLFHGAWTAQYDKIIGFITEVHFMAGEIFSPIPALTALKPMLLAIPWVLERLDTWSKVVGACSCPVNAICFEVKSAETHTVKLNETQA